MIEWLMSGGWIILCCFFGPAMLFTEPISERKRRREAKPAPKGKREKRTARKNRAVMKQNLIPQKPKKKKPWFVAPELSQHEMEALFNYKMKRDFVI